MNQNLLNRGYPLWLWVLTIIVAPIGLFLWETLTTSYTNGSDISIVMLFIPIGFFFSSPAFFVTFLLYQSIRKSPFPVWLVKVITMAIAIVCMTITLNIIEGSMIPTLKWAYGLTIVITGMLLKAINTSSSNSNAIKVA
ncbi:MAG: hypothetical protein EOO10_07595 [Chitinophagaceae bacterium]|nr:MAG: hypothetical protein EOO10_07595 [Chitinophagaceae bacterium]